MFHKINEALFVGSLTFLLQTSALIRMFIYFGLPFFKAISHRFFHNSCIKLAGNYNAHIQQSKLRVRGSTILLSAMELVRESGLQICVCGGSVEGRGGGHKNTHVSAR